MKMKIKKKDWNQSKLRCLGFQSKQVLKTRRDRRHRANAALAFVKGEISENRGAEKEAEGQPLCQQGPSTSQGSFRFTR